MDWLHRGLRPTLERAWSSSPVVVLQGPRAVGKTTLAGMIKRTGTIHDLSSAAELRAAETSPRAWVEAMLPGSVIDESQRLPSLAIDVKRCVDARGGIPGQFLLTGSVRLRSDQLSGSDPLVGRATRLDLLPFTQSELFGTPRDSVASLFDDDPATWNLEPTDQGNMIVRVSHGGMPFLRSVTDDSARRRLLQTYVENQFTVELPGSVRDVAGRQRLFRWLCASAGQIRDYKKFADPNELDPKSVRSYVDDLLELFLLTEIKPWHQLADRRESHKPRLFPIDPAFASVGLGLRRESRFFGSAGGPLLEAFVATELQRLLTWSSVDGAMFHWRKDDRREVDLIVEDRRSGRLLAIEVKSDREPKGEYFNGIHAFRDAYPKRDIRGIVMHCGDHVLRHSDVDWFVPFSSLWQLGDLTAPVATSVRSLSDALDQARGRVVQQTRFVDIEESEKWIEHAQRSLIDEVQPMLGSIAAELEGFGFTVDVNPHPIPLWSTLAPRTAVLLATVLMDMNIQASGQSTGHKAWLVRIQGSVMGDGTVRWQVDHHFGSVHTTIGSSVTAGWDESPRSSVEAALVSFVDDLPRLVAEWPR